MHEWNHKYNDVTRLQTHSSIDKDMIIFLGLTIFDFIAGVGTFLFVVMNWDSGLSIFVAIFLGCLASCLSKTYRKYFPPLFFVHFNWSLGIQKNKLYPNFFRKRRFKVYGP